MGRESAHPTRLGQYRDTAGPALAMGSASRALHRQRRSQPHDLAPRSRPVAALTCNPRMLDTDYGIVHRMGNSFVYAVNVTQPERHAQSMAQREAETCLFLVSAEFPIKPLAARIRLQVSGYLAIMAI